MNPGLKFNRDRVAGFCGANRISELSLFGSAVRDTFNEASDVDVLVTFHPDAHPTLIDLQRMEDELAEIFGRRVDLLTRHGVETSRNPLRRQEILSSAEVIHAA